MKKLFLGTLLAVLFGCGGDDVGPKVDIGIYINELQASGGDWLELYNSTTSAIDISGFKVYDDPSDKFTISSGSIASKGFLILNCDGTGVGGNTNFKLSSSGETVYLEDNKGNLVDEVTFPSLKTGSSYGRFPDGSENWKISGSPTKGETNGSDQAPTINKVNRLPIVPGIADPVTVSALVTDVTGISSVKLYYRKDGGSFSSVTMTLTVDLYTGVIPAAGTTGTIEYYIEAKNTKNVVTTNPSNAPTETRSYLLNTDDLTAHKANLKINEFLASNTTCCPDNSSGTNEFDDWFEIYNASGSPIDLTGWHVSDDSGNPLKFKLNSGTTIPANGYLLIWADENGSQGNLHANFQLAAAGEEIGLYYIDGREVDHYTFGAQNVNESEGRTTDGAATWKKWTTPTPGAKNQ